ncbi:hypothetical protein Pla22_32840 [Rubripirellula amarantea]|uniref:Uncharacterized protein n=1 Tax=Rubripirellula amarantea TaxID=2527999 RepID=A0A5C5WKI8_9BACT|nr:hypothetical protein [Rubripirellula amarantea]TWT50541.1 hypothetical protein Pla22_32840 [Rubripirellula amarantea]
MNHKVSRGLFHVRPQRRSSSTITIDGDADRLALSGAAVWGTSIVSIHNGYVQRSSSTSFEQSLATIDVALPHDWSFLRFPDARACENDVKRWKSIIASLQTLATVSDESDHLRLTVRNGTSEDLFNVHTWTFNRPELSCAGWTFDRAFDGRPRRYYSQDSL